MKFLKLQLNKILHRNHEEMQYLKLLEKVLYKGRSHKDRTGTGTRRLVAETMRFDLTKGKVPIFTTKKTFFKGAIVELIWMLKGDTNVNWMKDRGIKIWNEWANSDGSLGPVYGEQFRHQVSMERKGHEFNHTDPLKQFVTGIKENPESRRHIISLWNQPLLRKMNLPPCHGIVIQASVIDGGIYLEMYQRSCDLFLGVPFNVVFYSIFCHWLAKECGLEAKEFIWHGHDCHIYDNHIEQVKKQLSRAPKKFPKIDISIKENQMFDYLDTKANNDNWDEIEKIFKIINYTSHGTIKAPVSI